MARQEDEAFGEGVVEYASPAPPVDDDFDKDAAIEEEGAASTASDCGPESDRIASESGGGGNSPQSTDAVTATEIMTELRSHVDISLQDFSAQLRVCLEQCRAHQDDMAQQLVQHHRREWSELLEGPLGTFLEWHATEVIGINQHEIAPSLPTDAPPVNVQPPTNGLEPLPPSTETAVPGLRAAADVGIAPQAAEHENDEALLTGELELSEDNDWMPGSPKASTIAGHGRRKQTAHFGQNCAVGSPVCSTKPVSRRLSFSGSALSKVAAPDLGDDSKPEPMPVRRLVSKGTVLPALQFQHLMPPLQRSRPRPDPLALDESQSSITTQSSISPSVSGVPAGFSPSPSMKIPASRVPPKAVAARDSIAQYQNQQKVSVSETTITNSSFTSSPGSALKLPFGDDPFAHPCGQRTRLAYLVQSRSYQAASAASIVFGVGLAALSIDRQAALIVSTDALEGELLRFAIGETLLCLFFALDLGARVVAMGLQLLLPSERWWTALDLSIVGAALIDTGASWTNSLLEGGVAPFHALGPVYALRVLRLLQVVHASKSLGVLRRFHELRLLCLTLRGVVASLLWVAVGCAITFLFVAMVLTDGATKHCVDMESSGCNKAMLVHFGSLRASFFTLYRAVFDGDAWRSAEETLRPLEFGYKFAFHVCTTTGAMLVGCLVTAIFVDAWSQESQNGKEIVSKGVRTDKKQFVDSLEIMLTSLDQKGDGTVRVSDFENKIKEERVRDYFSAMELNIDHMRTLFNLLDNDQTGFVAIDKVVSSCLYLEGKARAVDVVMMQYELGVVRGMVHSLGEFVEDHFEMMQQRLPKATE